MVEITTIHELSMSKDLKNNLVDGWCMERGEWAYDIMIYKKFRCALMCLAQEHLLWIFPYLKTKLFRGKCETMQKA
jgi:hypothetical protein